MSFHGTLPAPGSPRSITACDAPAERAGAEADGARPVGGASAEVLFSLARESVCRAKALAEVQARADRGDCDALVTLGHYHSPFHGDGAPPRNARLAAVFFERAGATGNWVAAALAAELYDKGPGNLDRDPALAAAIVMRQLETDPDSGCLVTDSGIGAVWSPDFWAALQRALAERGLYTSPIESCRNEATVTAVRQLIGTGWPEQRHD